ncbi:Hypothetical protein A7982_00917 [Minicystis rosea]|nr:Hypothetical protein A7982_00917 [Minicystis rosea]
MHYDRARARYLAVLGLTGLNTAVIALGCQRAEPGAAPPAAPTATSTATASRHTEAWVPAVEPAATAPRLGMGSCPRGPFCVPQADGHGINPAPEPYAMCAADAALPKGIGPETTPTGKSVTVTFDAARTAAERASDPGACCYQWQALCAGGRALRGPEGPLVAPTETREDWMAKNVAVDVTAIPPAMRAALAMHWEREAAFEHASVASFARAALSLLAAGAPPDLVAATHTAAIDEVHHAQVGYALASAYAGAPRGPSALPLAGALGEVSLATIAVETFIDACAGESTAALSLREAAMAADNPKLCAILSRIAEDEERHAELAWRTVAWALHQGGDGVAEALANAVASLRAELCAPEPERTDADPDLSSFGVLGASARRSIRLRALAEVVLPCADALLGRGGAASETSRVAA